MLSVLSDVGAGKNGSFTIHGQQATREDFVVTNKKEEKIQCSQWQLASLGAAGHEPLPCVIYCHCNSGSRLDAEEAIGQLVPLGVRVFALDFTVRNKILVLLGFAHFAVMMFVL